MHACVRVRESSRSVNKLLYICIYIAHAGKCRPADRILSALFSKIISNSKIEILFSIFYIIFSCLRRKVDAALGDTGGLGFFWGEPFYFLRDQLFEVSIVACCRGLVFNRIDDGEGRQLREERGGRGGKRAPGKRGDSSD